MSPQEVLVSWLLSCRKVEFESEVSSHAAPRRLGNPSISSRLKPTEMKLSSVLEMMYSRVDESSQNLS